MENIAKQLLSNAAAKGGVRERNEFFSVTDKETVVLSNGASKTVETANGVHYVKILEQKLGKGKSFKGNPQDELQMTVQDRHNGKASKKYWNVPVKNEDDGKLHYIVEALAQMEPGEEFAVEGKLGRNGNYLKVVSKLASANHGGTIPDIQLEESGEGDLPPLDGGEDISPSDIPF